MAKDNRQILYTLTLRREVPILKDGAPSGEVKHLTETHKGCTYEQALELKKKAAHLKDAMIDKSGMGEPGKIVSSTDIGSPVNMPKGAPRAPREATSAPKRFDMSKPAQRAPQPREMPVSSGSKGLADLVNAMAKEEAGA